MKLVGAVVFWLFHGEGQWGTVEVDSVPQHGGERRLLVRVLGLRTLMPKQLDEVVVLWTGDEMAELVNQRARLCEQRWADELAYDEPATSGVMGSPHASRLRALSHQHRISHLT